MKINFQKLIGLTFLVFFLIPTTFSAQNNVSFMTFNIWQEGTSVTNGFDKILNIILEVNPDVICFTEVKNYNNKDWTNTIVNQLASKNQKYYGGYVGGDVSLISKYPITSSSLIYDNEGSIAKFNINIAGKTIIVGCAHLDYTQYASYLPRGYNGGNPNWNMIDDGSGNPNPITDIQTILNYNQASKRDEQIAAFLTEIKNETRPVILLGDFNEPSHLDWTKNTANQFDHNGVIINWPSTYTLFKNDFKDAYREFYPNEITNPGITWPSMVHGIGSTSWTPKSDERDRIDYIFYKGKGIETVRVNLVGPIASYAYGKLVNSHTSFENFLAKNLQWPSDHKAVIATLRFTSLKN